MSNTIKIGETSYVVELPKSFTVRHEIGSVASVSMQRAAGAALGLCVKGLRLREHAYKGNANQYGADVLDALVERGMGIEDLMDAGVDLVMRVLDTLPQRKEVEAIEGNSEPPAGGSP
jgi:hypothetical protein